MPGRLTWHHIENITRADRDSGAVTGVSSPQALKGVGPYFTQRLVDNAITPAGVGVHSIEQLVQAMWTHRQHRVAAGIPGGQALAEAASVACENERANECVSHRVNGVRTHQARDINPYCYWALLSAFSAFAGFQGYPGQVKALEVGAAAARVTETNDAAKHCGCRNPVMCETPDLRGHVQCRRVDRPAGPSVCLPRNNVPGFESVPHYAGQRVPAVALPIFGHGAETVRDGVQYQLTAGRRWRLPSDAPVPRIPIPQ